VQNANLPQNIPANWQHFCKNIQLLLQSHKIKKMAAYETDESDGYTSGGYDSALIWSDDPEEALFKSMIEKQRAGKIGNGDDFADSIMGDSTMADFLEAPTVGTPDQRDGIGNGLSWGSEAADWGDRRSRLGGMPDTQPQPTPGSRHSAQDSDEHKKAPDGDIESATDSFGFSKRSGMSDSYGFVKSETQPTSNLSTLDSSENPQVSRGQLSDMLGRSYGSKPASLSSGMSDSYGFGGKMAKDPTPQSPEENIRAHDHRETIDGSSGHGKPALSPQRKSSPQRSRTSDSHGFIKTGNGFIKTGNNMTKVPSGQAPAAPVNTADHEQPSDMSDMQGKGPLTLRSEMGDSYGFVRRETDPTGIRNVNDTADPNDPIVARTLSQDDSNGFVANWPVQNAPSEMASTLSNPSAAKPNRRQDPAAVAQGRATPPGFIYFSGKSRDPKTNDKELRPEERRRRRNRLIYLKMALLILLLAVAAAVAVLILIVGKSSEDKNGDVNKLVGSPTLSPVTFPPAWIPTNEPTTSPSNAPSAELQPSISQAPTRPPTRAPTGSPTTQLPTRTPTGTPSRRPSPNPTLDPTLRPTRAPTQTPAVTERPTLSVSLFYETLARLLEATPQSSIALVTSNSPQYRALDWMVKNDANLSNLSDFSLLQRWFLTTMYYSLGGSQWLISQSWLTTISECNWYAITCDAQGMVESIDLSENNLGGTLPNEVFVVSSLTNLRLDNNNLAGTIPSELGMLESLNVLKLNGNALVGVVPPELGDLARLGTFDFNSISCAFWNWS
jgi:hypothetical protein